MLKCHRVGDGLRGLLGSRWPDMETVDLQIHATKRGERGSLARPRSYEKGQVPWARRSSTQHVPRRQSASMGVGSLGDEDMLFA